MLTVKVSCKIKRHFCCVLKNWQNLNDIISLGQHRINVTPEPLKREERVKGRKKAGCNFNKVSVILFIKVFVARSAPPRCKCLECLSQTGSRHVTGSETMQKMVKGY